METRLYGESNVDTLYGEITKEQFDDYKTKLHKKLFWLLLYKDPETCSDFDYVDFDKYITALMKEITGLSKILSSPCDLVELLALLQAAYNETYSDEFNYKSYRKFVLDAHNVLDRLEV